MRNALISLLMEDAANDPDMIFLTGDLGFSVIEPLQEALGERFVNAGVAEANMMSMAGALAADGFHVYAYSIAPFIALRCYEQVRNDVCYGNRSVRLIGVGAGYSYGSLGPTHHSLEDASVMAVLPGMRVVSPATEAELVSAHRALSAWDGPMYYRIPRESGPEIAPLEGGAGQGAVVYRSPGDTVIVTSGPCLAACLSASDELAAAGITAGVVSIPLLTPFPADSVARIVGARPAVTVFEGFADNPLETGMCALSASRQIGPVAQINAGRSFASVVGNTEYLRERAGLTASPIADVVRALAPQTEKVGGRQ